ncbi:MAG: hypothetical protein J5999_00205 [Oscillospiraceae bacterium]|nr:hypothetical protein [Oscillospiraceae bacterium]
MLFLSNNIEKTETKPDRIQGNFAPVNIELERFIRGGQPCVLNEKLSEAFKRAAKREMNHSSGEIFKSAAAGILLIAAAAYLTKDKGGVSSEMPYALAITVIAAVLIGCAVAVIRNIGNQRKKAEMISQLAELPERTECYRYRCRLLCHSYYDYDEYKNDYYADLDDFYVRLNAPSGKWRNSAYAYGVIFKVNGSDVFFLFNEAE